LIDECLHVDGNRNGRVAKAEDRVELLPRGVEMMRIDRCQFFCVERLVRFANQSEEMAKRVIKIEVVRERASDVLEKLRGERRGSTCAEPAGRSGGVTSRTRLRHSSIARVPSSHPPCPAR